MSLKSFTKKFYETISVCRIILLHKLALNYPKFQAKNPSSPSKPVNHVTYLKSYVKNIYTKVATFVTYFEIPQIMKNEKSDSGNSGNSPNQTNIHMNTTAATGELEKSKPHIIIEIIEYLPNAIVSKTIIKKTTGNVTVSSFYEGEELEEKTSPFDNYIQIIDGTAEVIIGENKFKLKLGEGIIIPAHSRHCFNANEQFKMISTVIKSGYED